MVIEADFTLAHLVPVHNGTHERGVDEQRPLELSAGYRQGKANGRRSRCRWARHPGRRRHLRPLDVKVGDRVLFGKWSGTEIKIDGEDFVVAKESDIMGVVEETASHKVA